LLRSLICVCYVCVTAPQAGAGAAGGDASDAGSKADVFSSSPFIPSPNFVQQTGNDRNKLVVNPALTSPADLQRFFVIGQLMGTSVP
jgi:hypothetical protein